MNNTYCPLPWVGLNLLPGEVRPCCHWDGAPVPLDQIRKDMLEGKKLDGCSQCYFAEQVGSPSRRLEAIDKYGVVTDVSTQLLEINFDNICNLKCRGCCSFSSHLWHADEQEIYGKSFIEKKYIETDFEFDWSNLKQIDISGGEPLLSKNVEKFLSNLDTTKIKIGIVTNGTTKPSTAVYNALKNAEELYLTVSIDAIGELNDYFRSGSDFDSILKNIEHLNTLCSDEKHKLIINTTVSIYNVTHIKEVEEYFNKHYPNARCQHRMLLWPEPLAVQNMPDKLKEIVRPIVEKFGPNYNDVLEAINLPSKNLFGHFLNFHNSLDKLRNETLPNKLLADYIEHNPETVDSVIFFKQQMRG